MEELFITKVHIHEVRHLKDFDIPLSETERKHLILTGRNGSGKTSVLEAIKAMLFTLKGKSDHKDFAILDQIIRAISDHPHETVDPWERLFYVSGKSVQIEINNSWEKFKESVDSGNLALLYFPARRQIPVFETPKVIEKISVFQGNQFLKYLLNLSADRAFALEEKDYEAAKKIDAWFEKFRLTLKDVFGDADLEFDFNRKDYNYYIKQSNRKSINFNQLPDGFSSIVEILTELIMKCEETGNKAVDVQGIVLIDEIETHLHIDLQKKVLPFLTSFFPKIQFIVTTHSPFVLSSVKDAVICDLEKRIVTTDLSGYSSEIIVESYFGQDKYSQVLKEQVDEYEKLMSQETLTFEDEDRMDELETYFETIPKYLSDELTVKLQQIRLKNLKLQK